jgi:hypothetical protein
MFGFYPITIAKKKEAQFEGAAHFQTFEKTKLRVRSVKPSKRVSPLN